MSDEVLRDRIARAIWQSGDYSFTQAECRRVADAVMPFVERERAENRRLHAILERIGEPLDDSFDVRRFA